MKLARLLLIVVIVLAAAQFVFAVDRDNDGLSDDVEASLGSSPLHKDIFVEVDWLIVNGRSMKPRSGFTQIVTAVFASAPNVNPDGTTGIRLHVQLSTGIRYNQPVLGSQSADGSYDWSEFDAVKSRFFANRGTHHYCLFVRDYASYDENGNLLGSSGISRNNDGPISVFRQGASDLIVALGGAWWNQPKPSLFKWTQAGTFIHELGHNLGLMHGGGDHVSFKPHHLSLMSYAYQTDGIPFTQNDNTQVYLFDYNRVTQYAINENNINEGKGLGARAITRDGVYGVRWWLTNDYKQFFQFEDFNGSSNMDWNQDGSITSGVKIDINPNFPFKPPSFNTFQPLITLRGGVAEWARLNLKGGEIGDLGISAKSLPKTTRLHCLTFAEKQRHIKTANPSANRITFRDLKR